VLVPRNLEDITPDWLTEALAPAFPGGEVTGLSVTDVSYGSACRARLVLDSGPDGSLPQTLIAKGSFTEGLGSDEVAQQWLRLMVTLNSAEHAFYTSHAAALGDRAPTCFHADAAEDGTTILLLEDLRARQASFGAFDHPRSPAGQAQTLDALARLHASRWDDPALDSDPLPDGMSDGGMLEALLSQPNWEQQAERSRWSRVPAELDDRQQVVDSITRLWDLKRAPGGCLIHGDPHIANTFVDADGAGLLDFQLFTSGHWASDVVYSTASALTIEDRRAHERDLLAGYLAALEGYGATPPSWDEAFLAYRQFSLWGFVVLLTPGEGVQSEEYNTVVGERHAVAAVDLDALSAIG
jgi:hypothetical protein